MKNKKSGKTEKVNVATPEEIAAFNRAEDKRIEKLIAERQRTFLKLKHKLNKDGCFVKVKFCPACGGNKLHSEVWTNLEKDLLFRSCKNPNCGTHFAVCLKY